jgi:hypothetical protein
MKVMPPDFFSETYNYNEIYLFYGDIPNKVEIIFPHSLHYEHTFFGFALQAVCQLHKTPC